MHPETVDPSEGKKTTIYGETMDPPEGGKTTYMDCSAKAEEFLKNYYRRFEENPAYVVNLYREDSWINFDGENIQGKETILTKLTSNPWKIPVVNVQCLPVGGTGFSSGTGFVSGTDRSGGLLCQAYGYIRLDGKQEARPFSQMFVLLPTPEGSFDISHSIFSTVPESSGSALASSNSIFHTGHESSGAGLASSNNIFHTGHESSGTALASSNSIFHTGPESSGTALASLTSPFP